MDPIAEDPSSSSNRRGSTNGDEASDSSDIPLERIRRRPSPSSPPTPVAAGNSNNLGRRFINVHLTESIDSTSTPEAGTTAHNTQRYSTLSNNPYVINPAAQTTTSGSINRSSSGDALAVIDDKYSEAWDELGAPIFIPFIKYMFACTLFIVDNYFLVKNTYNAFTHPEKGSIMIALLIVGLHIMSCIFISILDSLNKDAIMGRRGRYLNRRHKWIILLRMLAHVTLTMRLFRYTMAYVENRRRNQQIHLLRMRRAPLSEREVQFVVDQKKNMLVDSTYDLIDSFFKTVPAALLQVFFMFKTNPEAKLSLLSPTDQDRFATVFFSIVTSSIAAALYQADYLLYKKILVFQDSFKSGFTHEINLRIYGDICLISNFPVQFVTMGTRMCFYAVLIFWSPLQFVLTAGIIISVNLVLTLQWNKTTWRFRPVLENPLYGIPWPWFEFLDLWINLFIPGVHYPKPMDYFLNFYTTLFTGVIVFQGFDFIRPDGKATPPFIIQTERDNFTMTASAPPNKNESTPTASITSGLKYLGLINGSQSLSALPTTKPNNGTESDDSIQFDPMHIVEWVINFVVSAHKFLTFNQISYASFFYNVVKLMNVGNLCCFAYTCVLNYLGFYDLDFPVQVVNSFYRSMLHALRGEAQERNEVDRAQIRSEQEESPEEEASGGRSSPTRAEIFLVFSMLRNSAFFVNVNTIGAKSKWHSVDSNLLDELATSVINQKKDWSPIWRCMDKVSKVIYPVLYPARFREAKYTWDIPTDEESIIASLESNPLREELSLFVNQLFKDDVKADRRTLLAAFCANYNKIVRHYTSYRLKIMFEFMEIPISKTEPSKLWVRKDIDSARRMKKDFDEEGEGGYWRRIVKEAKARKRLQQLDFF